MVEYKEADMKPKERCPSCKNYATNKAGAFKTSQIFKCENRNCRVIEFVTGESKE